MQVPVVGDDGGDDGVGPLHPAPAGQPPGGLRHYPGGGGWRWRWRWRWGWRSGWLEVKNGKGFCKDKGVEGWLMEGRRVWELEEGEEGGSWRVEVALCSQGGGVGDFNVATTG